MPVSAGGTRTLTFVEPPPWSWPGGLMVFESLLAAGRDSAGSECLRADWLQVPGGQVSPTLSQTDRLTGPAPLSCFNERSGGLLALQGLCWH